MKKQALFREEVGTTFRSFCVWKRARSFLSRVYTSSSLTGIGLDIGYSDSSHFSHTVRRYWGLTPKDILHGARMGAMTWFRRPGRYSARESGDMLFNLLQA